MTNENRRTPRSSQYQNLYNELFVAPDLLDSFSNQDNIFKRLSPHQYNETILELEEQLRKEFWRVIKENLTDKQQKVVSMLANGATQTECAKELNINQSSICKSLLGNSEYNKDTGEIKIYGGIKSKLRKVVEKDEKIKFILEQISELRDDTWIKE